MNVQSVQVRGLALEIFWGNGGPLAPGLSDRAGLMRQERGAALLMALLLAILVAVLASGMMQDEQRRVKLLENQRVRDEAEQMGVGALDWARLILREDLLHTGAVDHLGEVWAVPIWTFPWKV